jgi:hypothetical protein
VRLDREDVGDVLIGANHDDAPSLPVDISQIEHVHAGPWVGAEHLLVVMKAVSTLAWSEE